MQDAPFSLPFHSTVPISDGYKKSIAEAETEATELRKLWNEASEKADEKERLYVFKAGEAKYARTQLAKSMDELRYAAKQAKHYTMQSEHLQREALHYKSKLAANAVY